MSFIKSCRLYIKFLQTKCHILCHHNHDIQPEFGVRPKKTVSYDKYSWKKAISIEWFYVTQWLTVEWQSNQRDMRRRAVATCLRSKRNWQTWKFCSSRLRWSSHAFSHARRFSSVSCRTFCTSSFATDSESYRHATSSLRQHITLRYETLLCLVWR